ncbi:MAG: hypothetical protein K1W00_08350 [Lachnospiraceae bacterium]
MGYTRLFELLACLKKLVSIKALATCSGMTETKVSFILLRNQDDLGITFKDGLVYTEVMLND